MRKIERSETDVGGREHMNLNSEERRKQKMRKARKELSYRRTVMSNNIQVFRDKRQGRIENNTRYTPLSVVTGKINQRKQVAGTASQKLKPT